jgi:hypothetical protein
MGCCECDRAIRHRHLALVFLTLIFAATLTRAQDNYEIQVYGSDLVDPQHTMVELHSNFTIDGSKTIVDGVYPMNHAEHETVEITHVFNDLSLPETPSALEMRKFRAFIRFLLPPR